MARASVGAVISAVGSEGMSMAWLDESTVVVDDHSEGVMACVCSLDASKLDGDGP